ncbi:efflux RND transporter periplasmic adaptor subunit [Shewanella intestini]|uniref:Efflux RND transporter periplasmic adaptor subunit n=1 Tax=Shewanella intestini TaxID=2017544 RepID=A0ABS5HY74_9GAMM|nr:MULTISPECIES: efflux RND transporter periplasmic adaptor subunit [Shewanella]MBR9726722.1 efflux RND transporter periplasmic adaptor subunit [Shewanella intestini]MRG34712.1 efflux RND transporter periplasmic adaptor subunit [Shewanella sp. XMDDZSB0408]
MLYFSNPNRILTPSFKHLILIFFTCIGISGCDNDPAASPVLPRLQTVNTLTLTPASEYQQQQTYTGVIRAANTTALGFELAGKLNSIAVDSGDNVKQGQILAQLDTSLLLAEQKQLQASLLQTQADIDLAKSNLKRVTQLSSERYVSAQQLDENQQQVQSLLANKQRLEASLEATQLKINKSTLTAPFAGVISKRQQNKGAVINVATPIFTLVGQSTQLAYIGVPIHVAQQLAPAKPVDIVVGSNQLTGIIAGISAEVDSVTRTVQVRVALDSKANVINGEMAYFSHQQTIAQNGFWVPISTLTDGIRGLWNVLLVSTDNTGKQFIERRDVEIIYTNNAQAYITGAIAAQDTLVVAGLHKLVVGQQVLTQTPKRLEAL